MKFPRLAVALFLATLIAAPAFAGSVIEVIHPWARPTIPTRPGQISTRQDAAESRRCGDKPPVCACARLAVVA